jgi:hypothetical protein
VAVAAAVAGPMEQAVVASAQVMEPRAVVVAVQAVPDSLPAALGRRNRRNLPSERSPR